MDALKTKDEDAEKENKRPNYEELEKQFENSGESGQSVSDIDAGKDRGFWLPILVNWLNAGVPSLLSILFADHFLDYVEAAAGFLAPAFLIAFPCLITIELHRSGKNKIHPGLYTAVWVYMIGGLVASYVCLVMNLALPKVTIG